MGQTGRAAVFTAAGKPLEIREYPVPEPAAGAALIKISLANVCGSDLHVWRGDVDPVKRGRAVPIHQGHEGTGRIAALGDGITSDSNNQPLQVGDRVVFAYFYPCGRCRACLSGTEWACPHRMHYRATPCDAWPHFKGTFGDYYYLYPNHTVFKVPDELSDELVAGVNCAMAQVTCGLDLANLRLGETVVIQGAGGLGLYAIAVAHEHGAGRIIVVDGVQERLDLAARFGADELLDLRELSEPVARIRRVRELTDGWGADVVMDLAGYPAITDEGVQMVGPGGRYIEIGNISPGLTYPADPALWVVQNVTIVGNNHYGRRHLRDALDLLYRTRHVYPFDRIVSHQFPLVEVNEALAAQDKGAITRSSLVP
ncbi:MAG TPA: zinc-binding dehydrogenase [Chloroflexota bacterium]|nr:zinc-binding dehydrogenase [Chloroflexota bacterium]